jgi:glutamyl-tRNA reductase
MNLQVVFCNYHTAPVAVREKLAFSSEDHLQQAYRELQDAFPDSELVVLSTCNRVEVYAAHEGDRHPTHEQLAQFFSEFHGIPISEFFDDLLAEEGAEAVRHLFRVASSVDSMVLGESQIVNQVKDAYRIAQENNACGILTNTLFQRAIKVSGRVRTETKLSEGRVSVASVAVGDFGRSIFERFDDKMVLVIGAGEMAEETLRYLKEEGVRNIVVVNRSTERAEMLAMNWGGEVYPWDKLDDCLAKADIVVSTTGATQPVITEERYRSIRENNVDKQVFLLDLGAPRDIAAAVGNIDDNIFLYNIDDLETHCERNRKKRSREVQKASAIIEEETALFMQEIYHRATGPVVQRLRSQWHEIREEELRRLFNKLPHLSESEREQIEKTLGRVINKLLHPPLETLREESHSGTPEGLLTALKKLFHIYD